VARKVSLNAKDQMKIQYEIDNLSPEAYKQITSGFFQSGVKAQRKHFEMLMKSYLCLDRQRGKSCIHPSCHTLARIMGDMQRFGLTQ
jgi:hypothetical protein